MTVHRTIEPELAQGDLIKVSSAHNQAEAELLQARLSEVGVPSVLQRAAGFDAPDILAAGTRVVLVPESGAQTARDLLQLPTPPPVPADVNESAVDQRVFLGLLAAAAVLILVAYVAALAV